MYHIGAAGWKLAVLALHVGVEKAPDRLFAQAQDADAPSFCHELGYIRMKSSKTLKASWCTLRGSSMQRYPKI